MASAADIANRFKKRYGQTAASSARFRPHEAVTSTGILSLDYALGIGGWPEGSIIEVYGPPDIGKSSIIGFNAIVEAQKVGKTCAVIALEPGFDPKWAEKHGVDLDNLLILWPDDGKKAFDMLYDMVMDEDISLVVFDSIGALLRETEAGEKGKPSQGGQSALITWGVKRVQMPAWKRKKTILFLNQIRDVMGSMFDAVDSPGGHALKHSAEIRVQLKPGADRYNVRQGEGTDAHDVMVGRSIVAVVKRTKRDEGTNKRAVFDFYQMETPIYPFGVDKMRDVMRTARRTGVMRVGGGGWWHHDALPTGKLRGEDTVIDYLREHPEVVDVIRQEVLATLVSKPVFEVEPDEADQSEADVEGAIEVAS